MRRAVALVAATLCAVLTGGAAPAARPAPEDPAVTAARLDAVHLRIAGTAEEHRASELLNYRRVEGGIADCMRRHGRAYAKPPFVSFYRDFTDADFGVGNGGATLIDSLTAGTRRWELNVISGARLTRAGADDRRVRPEDAGGLNGCAEPFEYRGYTDFDPPAGTYSLASFDELQQLVSRDAAVQKAWSGYNVCMKERHGYVVGADRSDFLFAPTFALTDPPVDGAPAGPAWHRALARVKAVFAADVDCRRPAYVAAMRIVAAQLDTWTVRHRAEMRTIRAAWHRRVVEAATLPR